MDVRRTPSTDSPVAQEIRESSRLHLDLREPPTREQVGIGAGRDSVAYDRRPPGFLDTRVTLPEGKVLELQAISATAAATGLGGGPRVQPDYLLVIGVLPDADAAASALPAAARAYGFPQEQVDRTVEALREGRTGTTGVLSTKVGYLDLQLEVRLSATDGRVQLSYGLSWQPLETAG